MFLQTESDKYELGYARFLRRVRTAIQMTYEAARAEGLNQSAIAAELGVTPSVVSKRLAGAGNMTLRSVSDLFIAMGSEALEHFHASDEYIHDVEAVTSEVVYNDGNLQAATSFLIQNILLRLHQNISTADVMGIIEDFSASDLSTHANWFSPKIENAIPYSSVEEL